MSEKTHWGKILPQMIKEREMIIQAHKEGKEVIIENGRLISIGGELISRKTQNK